MNTLAQHRLSFTSLIYQVTLDTFLRCRLALFTITWSTIVIAFASLAIAMSLEEISVDVATEQISPFVYPITFIIAGILTIWGTWTRDGETGFPQRYFLLPISSPLLFGVTLFVQLTLSLLAVVVGTLPALLLGIEYHFANCLPVYLATVSFGMMANWCRTDLRFLAVATLLGAAAYILASNNLFQAVPNQPLSIRTSVQSERLAATLVFSLVSFGMLTVTGAIVISSQRMGRGFHMADVLAKWRQIRGIQITPSAVPDKPFSLFDNWTSPWAMITVLEFKRVLFPVATMICVANLASFLTLWMLGVANVLSNVLAVFSVGCGLIGCLFLAIRVKGPRNQLLSYQSTLPISDIRLGHYWLLSFYLTYLCLALIFSVTLLPNFLYAYWFHNASYSLDPIFILKIFLIPLNFLALFYTLLSFGRNEIIGYTFFGVLVPVMTASLGAVFEIRHLTEMTLVAVSLALPVLYLVIVWFSIRTSTFSIISHVIVLALVFSQIACGRDFFFFQQLEFSSYYGMLFLPVLPLAVAPLATYLNRHR